MAHWWGPTRLVAGAVLVALLASGCCLADCGPVATPFQSSVAEQLTLTTTTPLFVRHVSWTVTPGRLPATKLELRVVVSGHGDDPEALCDVRPGVVRIVPDDPSLAEPVFVPPDTSCNPMALDLLESCAAGCSGGATVILYSDVADPRTETPVSLLIALRGDQLMGFQTTGPGGGWGLQLSAAPLPGQERASRVETDFVEGAMDVFPSTPDITSHVVLRISGEALRAPLSGLHGTMRIGIRHVDGEVRLGRFHTMTVGSLAPFSQNTRTSNTEVDWLSLCQPDVDCEIPITFEAKTNGMSAGDEAAGPAFYRWLIKAGLDSLDGRELPAMPFTIEER